MEGRWARLAVSAHARRYLDYTQISRTNVLSVVKERLVLDEIERERVSELLKTKAVITAICFDDNGASSQANISEFISTSMPWMVAKGGKQAHPGGNEVAHLIEEYRKYQEAKNKGN